MSHSLLQPPYIFPPHAGSHPAFGVFGSDHLTEYQDLNLGFGYRPIDAEMNDQQCVVKGFFKHTIMMRRAEVSCPRCFAYA